MHGYINVIGKELWWESGENDRFDNKEKLRKLVKCLQLKDWSNIKKIGSNSWTWVFNVMTEMILL